MFRFQSRWKYEVRMEMRSTSDLLLPTFSCYYDVLRQYHFYCKFIEYNAIVNNENSQISMILKLKGGRKPIYCE